MVDSTGLKRRNFIQNVAVGAGLMGSLSSVSTAVNAADTPGDSDPVWQAPRSYKTKYSYGYPNEFQDDLPSKNVLHTTQNLIYEGSGSQPHEGDDGMIIHNFTAITTANKYFTDIDEDEYDVGYQRGLSADNPHAHAPNPTIPEMSGVVGLTHRVKLLNEDQYVSHIETSPSKRTSWGGFASTQDQAGTNWEDVFNGDLEVTRDSISHGVNSQGLNMKPVLIAALTTGIGIGYPVIASALSLASAFESGLSSEGKCGSVEKSRSDRWNWKQTYQPCVDNLIGSNTVRPNFQILVDRFKIAVPNDNDWHRAVVRHGTIVDGDYNALPSGSMETESKSSGVIRRDEEKPEVKTTTEASFKPPIFQDFGLYLPGRHLEPVIAEEYAPKREETSEDLDNPCGIQEDDPDEIVAPHCEYNYDSIKHSIPEEGSLLNYYRAIQDPSDELNPSEVMEAKGDYIVGDISIEDAVTVMREYFF